MEDNRNRNYDQQDRDYTDAPSTTDFEKSKLNNDPNQAYQENAGQFEEFSNDDPNRSSNNGRVSNSRNIDEENWNPGNNSERDIDDGLNSIRTGDFQNDNNGVRDTDLESDFDDDLEDDEVDDERDFDEFDDEFDDDDDDDFLEEDQDDEAEESANEKSNVDDDWLNREI